MARIVEQIVYKFEELSERAKERARDWWRTAEANNFNNDNSLQFDDFATVAEILGINLRTRPVKLLGGGTRYEPCIWYSGFSSQGDGACFEGSYSYAKDAPKKIRAYAGQDSELHRIADQLQKIQRKNFYALAASVSHRGHYYHSGCTSIDVERNDGREMTEDAEEEIIQLLRDFMDWMYRQLEKDYEYRMSDENVDESITINDYEFDEDGNRV